jgi:hypothetical protein
MNQAGTLGENACLRTITLSSFPLLLVFKDTYIIQHSQIPVKTSAHRVHGVQLVLWRLNLHSSLNKKFQISNFEF